MDLLGWRVGIDWLPAGLIVSIGLLFMCLLTIVLKSYYGVKYDYLVKLDEVVLIAVKWLMIFEISMTVVGSFFFDYIFNRMIEDFLTAGFVLLVVMICKRMLKVC